MEKLYSVKARASLKGRHLSGAERIVRESEIENVLEEIYKRVRRKNPDSVNIKIERIEEEPLLIEKTLKIKDLHFSNYTEANKKAVEILKRETGIPERILWKRIEEVHTGAAPNKENMRGAMIVNEKGERVELDSYRGIRTTTVDFLDRRKALEKLLEKGYTERTLDALALTKKNLLYLYIIAEYCISDEPDYTAGYVSTKKYYYRFSPLKEFGNPKGGRIYFVKNGINLQKLYDFLQKKPVLIKDVDI